MLDGLRGEDSISELCRKEGIAQNLYYRWSKEFLEAGKKRLSGDTAREASSDEVKTLAGRETVTLRGSQRRKCPLTAKRARCMCSQEHTQHLSSVKNTKRR